MPTTIFVPRLCGLLTMLAAALLIQAAGTAAQGQGIQQQENNPIEMSLVLMAIYFAVNFSLSQWSQRLELRPGRVGRAAPPAALGAEDQIPSVA